MTSKDRIEKAIRHIQTATDIDPWAMEIAMEAMQRMMDANDDLIRRSAAIKAVHEEFDDCCVWDESGEYTANEVERILDRVPSAQSEIIKCKDCIHRYKKINIPMCDFVDFCPTDSSYCSLGEK